MRLASLLCGLLLSLPAIAWDNFGHRLVARIAYLGLKTEVRGKVDALLGVGIGAFEDASVWADQIKNRRPNTKPWHYVNIPLDAEGYDRERDCPKGACVVAKVEDFIAVLKSDVPADQRREALQFVIHFVADIHQPLHCSDNNDRGGNTVPLRWGNGKTNLHEIWDHYVLTNTLNQVFDSTASGTVVDWCNESHTLAQQVVYDGLPFQDETVSEDYMRKSRNLATEQLAHAAARLAAVLDQALSGSR